MVTKKNKVKSVKKAPLKKEHFEVLLENMNDNIQLIAEGQDMFRQEVNQRFDESDKRFFDFQNETRANFKQIFECLSAMDDELADIKSELKKLNEDKIDKEKFYELENRVFKVEQELQQYKQLTKAQK